MKSRNVGYSKIQNCLNTTQNNLLDLANLKKIGKNHYDKNYLNVYSL